jgi:hypothetical protein
VLLAYVDESYCDDCYYMAALLCPEALALPLAAGLDQVVAGTVSSFPQLPADAELHGHDIFQGKRDWAALAPMVRARIGVYAKALEVLGAHDIKIIVRGVQSRRLKERYGERAFEPHTVVLAQLLERIDRYAKAVDELVLVIADEPGQKDHQLGYRTDLRHYQAFGTWGYSRQKITRVVDTLHFAPSSASRLVQAADLVAFLYHRIASTRPGTDSRADRANQRLWAQVEPRVEHSGLWRP